MAIPEPQRSEYVEQVILSLVEALKKIKEQVQLLDSLMKQGTLKAIQQAKIVRQNIDQLMQELNDKSPILIPAILYTVKGGNKTLSCPECGAEITVQEPDFRQFYLSLLKKELENV
ncbi:MAG: hypothetical protein DRP08_04805 [Candidatus Aenigmatarchaeota archaeon]|nr:MAG: hypothetical protein DRP08_04805 [Candidatus Aenigmarchaeota archaeon]